MKQLLICAFSLLSLNSFGQKVFFTSPKAFFDEKNKKAFYSSINLQGNLLLFNAPDYTIYAFDKNTGAEKWSYYTRWQSDIPPFFVGNQVWAKTDEGEIQLNAENGKKIKDLVFENVYTQPIQKDSLLYFTGIYDGGNVFAYDPKTDSILWQRFLAHGCMEKPYYLADKIIANAEGTNWIELGYSGKLKDATCDTTEHRFPSELPCARQFFALAHDGKPIAGKLAKKLSLDEYSLPAVLTTSKHTFLLNKEQLTVLGNKLKTKVSIDLPALADTIEYRGEGLTKLLAADDTHVWIAYSHLLFVYNHAKKNLDRLIDLAAWEPHQIVKENNNLWIISKKDGRLYGMSME